VRLDKSTLYDWQGLNLELFRKANHLFASQEYDAVMMLLSHTFDADNFLNFFGIIIVYALVMWVVQKIRGGAAGKSKHYAAAWIGVLCVLAVGFLAMGLTVRGMKEYFDYPRPYIAIARDEVRLLEPATHTSDDYRAFPSGHASFITLLVLSLWPVLSINMRIIGAALIPAVCWSRLAMGMHFPADVIAGFIITTIIVLLVRRLVYWLLYILFGLRC
jgi:signal peptidase II